MTMDQACGAVLAACPDQYAKTYAAAWLDGRVHERAVNTGTTLAEACRVQARYILSNMSSWKGSEAATVREALERLAR